MQYAQSRGGTQQCCVSLHAAAQLGHLDCMSRLLAMVGDAGVDVKDENGMTALMDERRSLHVEKDYA
jgi:hypothetical protein